MAIALSAISGVLNNLALKMAGFLVFIFLAYVIVYAFLRLIKVPNRIANLLGTIALLATAYFLIANHYFEL